MAPHKSESPAGTGLNADQVTNAADSKPYQKRMETLRVKAALSSHILHAIEGDNGDALYIFSKWAQVRQLESIERAELWLSHVAGIQ